MSHNAFPTAARRRRSWVVVAVVLGCAILLAGGVWAVTRSRAPAASPTQWATARASTVSDTVTATATVRLRTGASVRVGAQISGLVRRLNVTVGSRVRRGDVIAKIDARPTQARAAQARAQLQRAEVAAAKTRADLSRGTGLFAAGGLSGQQLDDLKGASALADASVTTARRDLAAASVDLAYVTIRAPIDGIVASVSTQQGETVASTFAAPTFVTIIQPTNLEVVAMVDEADIGSVRLGQSASFTTETYPDREFQAVVERIAPDATLLSGVVNYEVTLRIVGDVSSLKPQMTVNATLVAGQRRAVSVPAAAVRREGAERFVIVRRGGASVRLPVSVGATRSGDIDISRGVAPGDHVLVSGDPRP